MPLATRQDQSCDSRCLIVSPSFRMVTLEARSSRLRAEATAKSSIYSVNPSRLPKRKRPRRINLYTTKTAPTALPALLQAAPGRASFRKINIPAAIRSGSVMASASRQSIFFQIFCPAKGRHRAILATCFGFTEFKMLRASRTGVRRPNHRSVAAGQLEASRVK